MSFIRRQGTGAVKAVSAEFLLQYQDITHCGWLKKECDSKILKDYSKKYGVLYKGQLFIYDHDKASSASHVYDIRNLRIECKRENNQWGFLIGNPEDETRKGKKTVQFLVGSEYEMMTWVNHIDTEKRSFTKKIGSLNEPSPISSVDRYVTISESKDLQQQLEPPDENPEGHYQQPRSSADPTFTSSEPRGGSLRIQTLTGKPTYANTKPRSQSLPKFKASDPSEGIQKMQIAPKPRARSIVEVQPIPEQQESDVYDTITEKPMAPRPKPKPRPRRKLSDQQHSYEIEESDGRKTDYNFNEAEEYTPMATYDYPRGTVESPNEIEQNEGEYGENTDENTTTENEEYYCEIDIVIACVNEQDKHVLPSSVYQLHLDRAKTEFLFNKDGTPGIYLIRRKQSGDREYVLSALLLGGARHFIIYQEQDQLYLKKTEPRFSRLPDLIRHYMRCNLPTCHARLEKPFGGS